jgi:flagellin-like hook-associated protein FlgL
VDYLGNDDEQQVRIGLGVEVSVNVAGTSIFAKDEFSALSTAGLTGLQAGGGAVMGDGFHYLELRHDSTDPGTIGSVGLALANGGADDTLLGSHPLVIDQAAGTVRLGSGPAVAYPQPGDPGIADFTVENEQGGTLRLDFSGFTGANFTGTVRGDGSISTDGTSFVPLDFTQSDLELVDPDTGNVMRLDATGVGASGKELVHYSGAVNVFDVLGGIAEDLRNGDGLDTSALVDRLGMWLGELDRNHDNLLVGLGALGSRSERMSKSELRLEGVRVQLSSMLSDVQDADFSEVVLDMSKAEQTLQLAQQTGMRLMQNNLLRFL